MRSRSFRLQSPVLVWCSLLWVVDVSVQFVLGQTHSVTCGYSCAVSELDVTDRRPINSPDTERKRISMHIFGKSLRHIHT